MEPLQDPITLRNTIQSLRSDLASAKERIATLGTYVLADNVERWVKYTTMFNAPELVADTSGIPMVQIASIPANSVATGLRFAVPTLFAGTSITGIDVDLSSLTTTGGSITSGFTSGLSVFSITSATVPDNLAKTVMIVAGSSPTPIQTQFAFYSGTGSDLTDGQLDTYIRLSIPGSTGTTLPSA